MISDQEYDTLVLMLHSKTDHELAKLTIKGLIVNDMLSDIQSHKLVLEFGKFNAWGKDTLDILQLNILDMQFKELKEKVKEYDNNH